MALFTGRFALTGVAALIVAPDGRYLMQLRDAVPTIHMPGNWALFGGVREAEEAPDAALLRELEEELEFRPRQLAWFTELAYHLPRRRPTLIHKSFFEVPVSWADLDAMVLHEGQRKHLFAADELFRKSNVVPWDGYAVMLHARRDDVAYDPAAAAMSG